MSVFWRSIHHFSARQFCAFCGLLALVLPAPAFAQTLYYDTNGSTGGTSTSSTQNISDSVWTTDPTGSIATGSFVNGDSVVFSADDGVNVGTGAQNVTINGPGYTIGGLTINNGAVDLLGSGTPNPTIGAGGITINSDDGATTLDSTLGTITLGASQSWTNDSNQTFTVGSTVTSSGNKTLTFNGTGTGATTVSGNITGGIKLVDSSTTSVLNLSQGNNTYTGGTVINGGTVVAAASGSVGNNGTAVELQNGGTLTFTNANFIYNHATTIVGGGTLNFTGDTFLSGTFTGDTLTIGTGDTLDDTFGTQSISHLNFVGDNGAVFSRFILGENNGGNKGFINGSTINVSNGYIFDFATGNFEPTNTMTFASGTALEMRNGGTITLDANVHLPTAGTFTMGADDVGSGNMNVTAPLTLTGNLLLDLNVAGNVGVSFSGGIKGSASDNLNVTSSGNLGGNTILYLNGTNTFKGSLNILAGSHPATVDITGNSSAIGNSINVAGGTLAVGPGGSLPSAATVTLGDSGSDGGYFQIGDGSGTNSVTVGSIYGIGTAQNLDEIVGGNSNVSNLTVHEAAGVTNVFYGKIGGNDNGNNISLTANGPGILILARGDSSFTGGVYVDGAGTLETPYDGAIGPDSNTVTLTNNGQIFMGASIAGVDGNTGPIGGGYYFNHQIIIGTGGGEVGGQYDYIPNTPIVMANPNDTTNPGLTVVSGDFLSNYSAAGNLNHITVTNPGTRLLMFQGGIIEPFTLNGNTVYSTVLVKNGATFDIGYGGSGPQTVDNQITLASGTAIEDRGTNVTLDDLVVPTQDTAAGGPTFIIGSDDVGGGNITVQNSLALNNFLNIEVSQRVNGATGVYFNGNVTGTVRNLSTSAFYAVDPNNANNVLWQDGTIHLAGVNSYKGDTTVNSGRLDITGNNTAVTNLNGGAPNYIARSSNYSTTTDSGGLAYLQIGAGGSIASNAKVTVGSPQGLSFFVLGDGGGAVTQNIGLLDTASDGGDNASVIGGSSTTSNLIVNLVPYATDTYNGIFGSTYNTPSQPNQDNLGVTFNIGTNATMVLGGFQSDNIAGGFTINGGKLVLQGIGASGVLGTAATNVTLNNATLYLAQNIDYDNVRPNQHFILGTGKNTITSNDGITSFGGTINAGAGSELHVSGPNMLLDPYSSTASNYSTLDIDSGRTFIYGNNYAAILPTSTVNVVAGATLDFATSSAVNSSITYNFNTNTGLAIRPGNGGVTNLTLSNANLPGQGTFTVGADDENSGGSINISSNQTLTGPLTLAINGGNVPVTLSGGISGSGGLKQVAGANGPGNLYVTGTNTNTGAMAVTAGNMYIEGDNSGGTTAYNVSGGATMDIGSTALISNAANVTLGSGTTSGTFELGDSNGIGDVTVASIKTSGTGSSNQVVNGSNGTSTFTVNNSTADTYAGAIGGTGTQNNVALVKSGSGKLTLSGNSTYTGGTTVSSGQLAVNGSIVGNVTTSVNASIMGSGLIAGTIGGAGSVDPGNSPGILTASATDPSGGLTYNFELKSPGAPVWNSPTNSGNDVLHLTSGMPFTSELTTNNVVNVYFARENGTYDGTFFVDGTTDNLTANIQNAVFNYYLETGVDSGSAVSYNGHLYDQITSGVTMSVISVSAVNFGAGPVDGFTGQFNLEVDDIPEPSTWAMMIGGLGVLVFWQYRTRKSRS